MNYTHLLFDVDDTLLDFQTSQTKSLLTLFKETHFPASALDTYRDISENLWRQIERQEITLEKLKLTRFSRLCEAYEREVDQGMERRYEQLLATHGDLIPDALEVIQHLSTTYQLSLITNGMPEITLPRLKQSGINTYFQHIFISETMGVQKPDPAFFEIVLETLQTEREDCLIIGDSLTSDIAGGLASHIDTCLVKKTSKRFSQPTYQVTCLKDLLTLLQ